MNLRRTIRGRERRVWRDVDKCPPREPALGAGFPHAVRGNPCQRRLPRGHRARYPGNTGASGVLLALLLASVQAGAQTTPNWDALAGESAELLSELIRIDTTNPPGNERPAAELL